MNVELAPSSTLAHLGVVNTERWVVMAFRSGPTMRTAFMFPRHRDKFPVCGSRQEAHERAMIVRATDPVFAARWRGWMFTAVPLDGVVEY